MDFVTHLPMSSRHEYTAIMVIVDRFSKRIWTIPTWDIANAELTAELFMKHIIWGNRCSQPLILRPFGRSGRELPAEYQVEARFINFSVSTAKKGYRQGPGSGNLGESLSKATISQRQYWYQNHRKITYKKTNFLCVYPLPVLRPDLDSSQDSRKVSPGIFQKYQKLTKL